MAVGERLDGKALAKEIRGELKKRVQRLHDKTGKVPGLHVILVGEDTASQIYVRHKERAAEKVGIRGEVHRLPAESSEADVLGLIETLNGDEAVHGILLQLPLPNVEMNRRRGEILKTILPEKDVDGLHLLNAGSLVARVDGMRPCTPRAVLRLIEKSGIDIAGKRALVVGSSALVGTPAALMLMQAGATVTIAHSRTKDLADEVRRAEILVAAVGRPGIISGEWIRPGAVVIDVGINRLETGKLAGDVDFDEAIQRAAAITPVPGGVGPMTIAMLLDNTVIAAERALVERHESCCLSTKPQCQSL